MCTLHVSLNHSRHHKGHVMTTPLLQMGHRWLSHLIGHAGTWVFWFQSPCPLQPCILLVSLLISRQFQFGFFSNSKAQDKGLCASDVMGPRMQWLGHEGGRFHRGYLESNLAWSSSKQHAECMGVMASEGWELLLMVFLSAGLMLLKCSVISNFTPAAEWQFRHRGGSPQARGHRDGNWRSQV